MASSAYCYEYATLGIRRSEKQFESFFLY